MVEEQAFVLMKPEPCETQAQLGSGGSRARVVAAGQNDPAVNPSRFNVSFQVHLFHCGVAGCNGFLKPPVFKCDAGHLLCSACRGGIGDGHCGVCNCATTFARCPEVEMFIGSARVPCPYKEVGCDSSVVYHDIDAHRDTCAYAPCRCLVPGCIFAASPPTLRDHFAADHSWPVHKFPSYSVPHKLCVPAEDSQRLLVVEGDEPRVFLLTMRWNGPAIAVSVRCVRASAAAGPHFKCSHWATGPTSADALSQVQDFVYMETVVASYAVPGGPDLDEGMWLYAVCRRCCWGRQRMSPLPLVSTKSTLRLLQPLLALLMHPVSYLQV